jgi:hypothetical protein
VHDDAVHVGVACVHDPAAGLARDEVGEVAEGGGDVVDVDAALFPGLPRVPRLGESDLLAVALEQVRDPAQERGALGDGSTGPLALVEGAARGGDCGVGVRGAAFGDDGERGGVSGVEDLPRPAGLRGVPVAVDMNAFDFGHLLYCLPRCNDTSCHEKITSRSR